MMKGILFVAVVISGAFVCHSVTVKTNVNQYIQLSTVGIDVSKMTSLSFKLQTCTYGQVILSDADRSHNISVYANYYQKLDDTIYAGICASYICNENSTGSVYMNITLALCNKGGDLWISWSNGSVVFGEGKTVEDSTLLSFPLNFTIAKAIVGSNATSILDTWEFVSDNISKEVTTTTTRTMPKSSSPDLCLTSTVTLVFAALMTAFCCL